MSITTALIVGHPNLCKFLKRWLDEVLVSGWAYGPGAPGVLAGKTLRVVTTTGGVADAYHSDGFHGWEFDTVLAPLKATARRLGMAWLEPMIIHGVRDLTDHALADLQIEYRSLLALDDDRPLRTAS